MIYKRGSVYWTRFQHQGRMVYKSTGQTSATKARQCEARLRSELALGHFGILEQKPIPTLAQFIAERIAPKATANDAVENDAPRRAKRFRWLRTAIKPLSTHAIGKLELDRITSEHVAAFVDARLDEDLSIGTVNRELRVLRRILRLAVEWNAVDKAPRVAMAGDDPFRVRVVTDSEFAQYLLHASPLLADVTSILNDTGLRPDELHRLRWEDLSFSTGRYGSLSVRHGKTKAARRPLPMTARVRCILEARSINAGRPTDGWVFAAESKSGHITHSSLRKAHARALLRSGVAPLPIYSLRHTFATRLALSPNMDAWTLCRIMGWSSLTVAMRYIHPSGDRVLAAFEHRELSSTGDKTGDSAPQGDQQPVLELSASPAVAVA
jgi:integrase